MNKNEKNQIEKTVLRKKFEELKEAIYTGWIKDQDKIKELTELSGILEQIYNKNTIEEFFDNQSDFYYFIGEFSKETLTNILRQGIVFGNNGDEVAQNVLIIYIRLFYKFMDKPQYQTLWDNVKEIFDSTKIFYKGFTQKVANLNSKKMLTAEQYNESYLPRMSETKMEIKEGMEIDVLISNPRAYLMSSFEKKVWVRGVVRKVNAENFSVCTAEDPLPLVLKYNSYDFAPKGTMTKDWEWRQNLQVGNNVDCFDRQKWYPGTISEKKIDSVNGLQRCDYRVTFKIFASSVPNWKDYTKFWHATDLKKDSLQREYIGDADNFDEIVPHFSGKLQKFNSMTFSDILNKLDSYENQNYFIDDMVKFIDENGKKVYVIGRTNNFAYYFAMILNCFAEMQGFEKMISCLSQKSEERISTDLIHVIFYILNSASGFFHKEYVIELGKTLYESIFNYLNEMNQNELRSMKKETIELVKKVLRFYLGLSHGTAERNEMIEKFSMTFALKLIKTTYLDKRISAIKTLIESIKSAKNDPEKRKFLLDLIEEHKIFYEIYGHNSHIQLVSKSKELLEMIIQEDRLSDGEMEMIWNATKKGDLEGKLTILRTLKDISKSLKPNHVKGLLAKIYSSGSSDLLNDEIDLIYELSTSQDSDEALDQCIKFFTTCLLESETDEGERIDILINKIFEITKRNPSFRTSVIQLSLDSLDKNENTILALKILHKYLKDSNLSNDFDLSQLLIANDNLVFLYVKSFEQYLAFVKEKAKTWAQDIDQLPLRDNFSHSQNIKARLNFISALLDCKLWKIQIDPIDFIYKHLIEDGLICEKDQQHFYSWIKSTIEKSVDYETEEKIFKLFHEKICKDSKACMNLSIEAFDSYLKVFLDINMKNANLKYIKGAKDKSSLDIEVYKDPEQLIGFSILWKIVFESFSQEIMNKGIEILHVLFTNVKGMDTTAESSTQLLIEKCINLIKDVNISTCDTIFNEVKKNIIKKCLLVLRLIIEESEKKGTADVISHQGLLKRKIITIKVISSVGSPNARNFTLRLYGNTTVWDMKRIISLKLKYHSDFLKFSFKKGKELTEIKISENGKLLNDIRIENADELLILPNGAEKDIKPVELDDTNGPRKQILDIFNEWFDQFSTDYHMTKEDLARFVQMVTGNKEIISTEDSRVISLFKDRDKNSDGLIEREEFVQFYIDSLKPEKKKLVWENLRCMGLRNDLKKISEPLIIPNEDKTTLPRYQLTNNEEFFNVIFYLQDNNEDIAKEAFNFLCILATNPKIYRQILFADGSTDWNTLLSDSSIYKLIYSLQIIESFIEDIEINADDVDNHNLLIGSQSNNSEPCTNKEEWMKNFITKGGYTHLVTILQRKLNEFSSALNDTSRSSSLPPMTSICIEFLLKIVKIFYVTSLCKFEGECADKSNENPLVRGFSFGKPQAMPLTQLESYFISEGLCDVIINSIDHNSTIPIFLSCIDRLIIMQSEKEEEIIETIFEFLAVMIPNAQNSEEVLKVLLQNGKFIDIVLYGILNSNDGTRAIFSNSLIKMCKLLEKRSQFILVAHLFQEIFNLIQNISKEIEKNSYELFEFFSCLLEIYTHHPDKFNSITIDSIQFIKTLLDSLERDINEDIAADGFSLSDELFLGFLKIVSKVAESNQEIKIMISKNYNLIQGILTKVLFKQSSAELVEKLSKIDFINPDKLNDSKTLRNSNQKIRDVCYRFILSMLKDSIDNFEKFFNVKLLDEKKESEEKKKESRYSYYSDYGKAEGHVGLKNLGCICYMNATNQQLYMVPSFRHSLLRLNDGVNTRVKTNNFDVDDNLLHQMQRMFSYLDLSERSDYNPFGYTYAFKEIDGGPTKICEQKDAQEYLSICLDRIERQIKETPGKYTIQSVFGGKTCSQVICENCGNTSSRYEDTPFLSLEVKNMKTLSDSLEKLITHEKIDEYSCDACKKKVSITKRNSLFSLPNVLIVHLQRIFYNWEIDRNEKINSRLEFPRTLNMKQYCLEEIVRKSAAAKAKDSDEDINIDTDEIYFKHQSYYDYYLVGVIVHSGSADAGHYYSYINTIRGGMENEANYNPSDETHVNSWLEFNDSTISKFNCSRLEDECFGGNYENEKKEATVGWWNKGEKSRSAYMLVYERKMKSPLKVVIDPKEIQGGVDQVISFKEEEYQKIKKEYDIFRYIGSCEYPEMKKKIFESLFYDVVKNEYFKYSPFYYEEKLIPKEYYFEILDDNSSFRKQKNIADQKFASFFDEAINLLDETLNNLTVINEDTVVKISMTFMNFILSILSKKDRASLLKSAKEKFVRIVKSQPSCLVPVWKYIDDHQKEVFDAMLNENDTVGTVNCELISDLINALYQLNPEQLIAESKKTNNDSSTVYSICMKTISSLLLQFPRIPGKLTGKAGPIMKLFRVISLIDASMLEYLGRREFIFIFITFLLGKDSPCYNETFTNPADSWGNNFRQAICGYEPVVELIYDIIMKSNAMSKSESAIEISARDIKCISSSYFLKFIFKSCKNVFSSLMLNLNNENYEFTVQSCGEIAKSIEEINFYTDSSEFTRLAQSLIPILTLQDTHQRLRFEILLGLPQFVLEESYKYTQPLIGFHSMMDQMSKYTLHKSTSTTRFNSTLIKKIFDQKSKRLEVMQVFLMLLEACLTSNELYKYIRMIPADEIGYKDFIQWGVNYMGANIKSEDNPMMVKLGVLLQELDQKAGVLEDSSILPGFRGFLGGYLIKDIKREEISLIHNKDNIYVFHIEYFTNVFQLTDVIDFTKSKSFHSGPAAAACMSTIEENKESEIIEENENLTDVPDDTMLISYDNQINISEKEMLKNSIAAFSKYKKVIFQNKYSVPGFKSTLKRYLVLNTSPKDANVEIKFTRLSSVEDPNEYIPASPLGGFCASSTIRNLYLMAKLSVDKDWTDGNNLDIQFKYDISNTKAMTMITSSQVSGPVHINYTPFAHYSAGNTFMAATASGVSYSEEDELEQHYNKDVVSLLKR